MNTCIEIALASNEGYVCGLVVTAGSIALNANRSVSLHFNILDCGIKDATYEDVVRRVSSLHPSVSFSRYFITNEMLRDVPEWHGGKSCYARLFLPSLLNEIEYVIYCDVDFLWIGDIAELWGERCEKALVGTLDQGEETLEVEAIWHKDHGLEFDRNKYFCSGLSFMNLKRFREMDYGQKAIEFIMSYPDVKYPDQAALNYVLRDDVKYVNRKWQQFSGLLSKKDAENLCVIHYAGDTPWKRQYVVNMLTDALLLWHSYYAKIYNISVEESLHKFFTSWQIFYRRAIWNICGFSLGKKMVMLTLRLIGKKECARYIDEAYVPLTK